MVYTFPDPRCFPLIQMLPVELLSYIFTIATHEVDEDKGFPIIDSETIKTPLILSRVNHHWRNVAHETPSLWSSICVTGALVHGGQLNTTHLSTYLALSQNHPLDVLIDARDEQWDFQEPGVEDFVEHEGLIYEPPFTPTHMCTAISLLLPHMFRWRSLSILTDSWAQMYVGLREIQPFITAYGAPCLEALTLMRCNDFISYSHTFAPSDMRLPAFLNLSNTTTHHNLLPRLRHLTLRGVHVDWSSLSYILSKADHGLSSLDLSSHCLDVRPTLREFHQLLSHCPDLTGLVVKGSGPLVPDDNGGTSILSKDIQPVNLPRLRDMVLGYRSTFEGQAILEIIDAPHVESLTLDDDSHPSAVEDLNAGSLLTYIMTRNTPEPMRGDHDSVFIYTTPDGEIAVDKDDFVIPTPKSPIVDLSNNSVSSRAVFPQLRDLTLRGVKAHEADIHHFLNALQHLRRLEFKNMPVQSLRALHPQRALIEDSGAMLCPCPQLQYLCIRKAEHAPIEDFFFLVGAVARERFNIGGSALQSIDIYVDQTWCPVENVIQLANVGTTVKIIREDSLFDEDDFMDCDTDSDLDSAFEVDGMPNDSIFDVRYGGILSY
ncbi:hypothetical protein C0995_007109 [Termitomyces sp. Mi166|nr:hypothetical protein C0995_007109 [Termitomyces sp. Mi166\